MPKIITSEDQLRSHLPNIVQTVKGERPYLTALSNYLDLAEEWVITNITSKLVFDTITYLKDENEVKKVTSRLVLTEALRKAIPSLDIVLTPNGFGIVNSSNISPASKPRVDRLIGAMTSQRDECIAALLKLLIHYDDWIVSDQGKYFGETLFPNLNVVDTIGWSSDSKWDKYQELHSQIFDLEASLAEEWFSPELMTQLRSENLRSNLTIPRLSTVLGIKSQIVNYLKGGTFNSRRLMDIVNNIRQRSEDFPEWHSSETAKLFAPPVFRNVKKSAGYFF